MKHLRILKPVHLFILCLFSSLETEVFAQASCEQSLETSIGIQAVDNSQGDQWFKFVAPKSGEAVITTGNGSLASVSYLYQGEDTRIEIHDACEDGFLDSDDGAFGVSQINIELMENTEYFILMDDQSTSGSYEFELFYTDDLIIGTEESPLPISMGFNGEYGNLHFSTEQWFEYEFLADGLFTMQFNTIYDSSPTAISTENAVTYTYPDEDSAADGFTIEGTTGDKVLFSISGQTRNNTFNATFESDAAVGETCESAIDLNIEYPILDEGRQIAVDNTNGSQFYIYTADKVGTLEMWSGFANAPGDPNFETDLKVYQTACDNLIADIDQSPGLLGNCSYVTEVEIGDVYIFEWSNHNWAGTFLADYYFQEPVGGTSCDDPLSLAIGENEHTSIFYDQYFEYTAPSNGTFSVSTCGYENAYSVYGMQILDGCDGNSLGTTDWDCDPNENFDWFTITYEIQMGETIIVKTNSRYHDPYDFNANFISDCMPDEEDVAEESCVSYIFDEEEYFESGEYSATFTNVAGCDSLVNLTLTILESDEIEIVEESCDSYIFNDTELFESGDYSATFTNEAGCDSLVNLSLTILDSPSNSITLNGVILFAEEQEGVTYQWIDCDTNEALEGEIKKQLTPKRAGFYAVEVSNENCTVRSECMNSDGEVLGVSDVFPFISAFPNPTSSNVQIELEQTYDQVAVEVLNIAGHVIHKHTYDYTKNIAVDLSERKGVYFVRVRAGEALVQTLRVIKE